MAYAFPWFKVEATILESHVYISELNKIVKNFKRLGIIANF